MRFFLFSFADNFSTFGRQLKVQKCIDLFLQYAWNDEFFQVWLAPSRWSILERLNIDQILIGGFVCWIDIFQILLLIHYVSVWVTKKYICGLKQLHVRLSTAREWGTGSRKLMFGVHEFGYLKLRPQNCQISVQKNWVFEANFAKLGQVGTNIMAFTPDICINHNMIWIWYTRPWA